VRSRQAWYAVALAGAGILLGVGLCDAWAADTAGGTATHILHLPPDAFETGGPLGGLEITRCRVVLADGENASRLEVSPAMAARGFPGLAFTFPPLVREYDLGLETAAVRVRIPGTNAADPATTIQSTSFGVRVAGTHLRLAVRFESEGAEFVGEFSADGPLTGKVPWRHVLDVQADNLLVTVDLPLVAQGMLPAVGEVTAGVDFTFAVTAFGTVPVTIDDAAIKEHIVAAARDGLRALFSSPGFRGGLSMALGALVLGDPSVAGLPVRGIELVPAADGGLDVRILTTHGS
jgi:hypothetical protein